MATGQPEKDVLNNGISAEAPDQDTAAPDTGEQVWDEEKIEQALKTLKEMHMQVG
jgi:hypothetical protein